MKNKVTNIISTVLPLPMDNIDTDQILPAKFLKGIDKTGYEKFLFYHWRFEENGKPKASIFNNEYKNIKILLTGENFGCGSSREHAVWALKDFGFKVIISSTFGDIFKTNALNNHILPLEVSNDFIKKLFKIVEQDPDVTFSIDIEKQTLSIPSKNFVVNFQINPYKKKCLIYGYDDISFLLSLEKKILAFEKKRKNDFSVV